MFKGKKYLFYIAAVIIIVLIATLFSFRSRPISQEKFVNFYIDYLIAQDTLGNDAETSHNILKKLYVKHKIDSTAYLKTLDYYSKEPKEFEVFFDSVISKLERRK